MKKERAQSLYLSDKHNVKQHCSNDTACQKCCKCAQRLKKQNKVLLEKNQGWGKQKQMLQKEIMRLRKEIREWEKKKFELEDLAELKRKLREELKFQMDKERKVDDIIMKEKLASITEERNGLKKQKQNLLERIDLDEQKSKKMNEQIRRMNGQLKQLQQQFKQKCQQVQVFNDQLLKTKEKNQILSLAVSEKTNVISKFQEQFKILEKNYLTEKSKCADFQFQLLKSKQDAKTAALSVQQLKRKTQQSNASIKELTHQNTKLDSLVKQLDSTICSYTMLQGELRNRILYSQQYALQKQIETKKLQSDFYNAIYHRSA